jgi:hypothetical protein
VGSNVYNPDEEFLMRAVLSDEDRLARCKFTQHKVRAARRGVAFLLSFEEWIKIWKDSGHWHERGPGAGRYCMARYGDEGAYAVGNVHICTNEENTDEVVVRGLVRRGLLPFNPYEARTKPIMSIPERFLEHGCGFPSMPGFDVIVAR